MEWNWELGGAQAAAIALAVISGAIFLLLLTQWIQQSRRGGSNASTAETAELHASLLRLQGELPELLRNMSTRLDAKMRAVRELIHDASTTIEELRRLKSTASTGTKTQPHQNDRMFESSAADSNGAANEEALTPSPAPATERKSAESPAVDPVELRSQRYSHVYSLADAGLDAPEISAETGMLRGEVELVLSLRRKRVRVDRASRPEPARVQSALEEATA